MFDLKDKKVFVTGSARGIGKAIADACVKAGATVLYHGATESEKLIKAAEAAQSPYVAGDLSKPEDVSILADNVRKILGNVDVLILNGSVQSYTGIENFTVEEFNRQMQTNVASCFQLIGAFAPGMMKNKWGRIIAISSINQIRPADRLGIYATTKAALVNLMLTAAKKYAAYGITANTVLPGVIETDRNAQVLSDKEFADNLREIIPAKRFGTPDDCAGIALFLASDAAGYVTGAEIPVAGGMQL